MSKPLRCDACGKRVRRNQHELRLSDLITGQIIGCYHARPECMGAAKKYLEGGVALTATFAHPDRCGPNQENCDAGIGDAA